MAHILTFVCALHPYGQDSDEEVEEEGHEGMECLVKWDAQKWSDLRESFEFLRTLLLRQDAELNYNHESDVIDDGANVVSERANSRVFTHKYPILMNLISIHETLAPIRLGLEAQIQRSEGKKAISKRRLEEVWYVILLACAT